MSVLLRRVAKPARVPTVLACIVLAAVLAGCATTAPADQGAGGGGDGTGNAGPGGLAGAKVGRSGSAGAAVEDLLPRRTAMGMTSHLLPAKGILQDLYEPTITVSGTGAIYVAGHVIGAYTTGTPAYVSTDDGATWKQLPIVGPVAAPIPVQGAAPPGGDEGIIVADDDGNAWMVDMQYTSQMSVQGWCDDGATACYYHPDAYDNAGGALCEEFGVASVATDRPWVAHAEVGGDDTLLLVNNGYLGTLGNVVQVGILDVQGASLVNPVPPLTLWNGCAGGYADGYIPGVPALDDGGRWIVPQVQDISSSQPHLKVITGTVAAGLWTTTTTTAFDVENTELACSSNFGFSGISDSGTFFVAAADTADNKRIKVAATTSGTSFKTGTITTTNPVAFLWITGSQMGEGALISWAEDASGGDCTDVDFYAAHVTLSATGFPQFADTTTVASGMSPCGDLMGSSVGPDGNAAVVVFSHPNQCLDTLPVLPSPLRVYVQTSGPTI